MKPPGSPGVYICSKPVLSPGGIEVLDKPRNLSSVVPVINTDHLTKGKTMENRRKCVVGCPNEPLAPWERALLGMTVHVETHDGESIAIEDVRPESLVWQVMRTEQPDGSRGTVLVLSMEHVGSNRITCVPNVRIWFTE